ncbi:NAD(P)-binding protein [Gautieria morchelliformis]|nr:NAD(P)-binding protein [Gautieria morchelliformis]
MSFSSAQLKAAQLFDVQGWVVVVTGGGTGLGLITAVTFLVNGAARVYITGRRAEVLQKAAETYNSAEDAIGEIVPVVCDVTKKDDIEKLVATVRAKNKFVNILVNNASVGGVKNDFVEKTNVEDISKALFASDPKTWNEALNLNTSSMFFTSAAFLPLLVAAKGSFSSPGSILNISSMSGITKQSQGGQFPYNTAKAGTIALTKQLAYEFRRPDLGIRVNTLAPGFFPSEMTPADLFAGNADEVRARWGVPIGRQGRPTEYAQAVLNLAVNEYMNGSTVVIDGGWLLEQS